jgi:hypothetical protein
MKVKTVKPYTLEEIKGKIEQNFPEYKVYFKTPKMLTVEETPSIGANFMGEKKNFVRILEGFPNMGRQMLFVLSILFFGILIPFIIWHFTVLKKQKALTKKLGAFIDQEYGSGSTVNDNKDLID